MYNMFGQIASGGLGLLASVINTRQINEANKQIARETNAANREMVEMQNKAAAAESEKAYQRSKASTQVSNMMQAGMSRAGAINALNGGGSYTPAPVNTSQDSAPQMQTTDFGALANIGQAFAQRMQQKHDEKMQAKQLAAQKEENAAQRESNERIAQLQADTTNRNADSRLEFDKENARKNWRLIDKQVSYIEKQTESLGVQIKGYELDNLRKEMENKNYPQLARLMNEQAQQEIQNMILEYNQAVENHELDKRRKQLENRYLMFTEKYRVDAENMRNQLNAFMDSVHLESNSGGFGVLACLEILVNNYLPALVKSK